MSKINSFQDLEVWKRAHGLVLDVYRVTKKFPDDDLVVQAEITGRLLNGLINSTERRK